MKRHKRKILEWSHDPAQWLPLAWDLEPYHTAQQDESCTKEAPASSYLTQTEKKNKMKSTSCLFHAILLAYMKGCCCCSYFYIFLTMLNIIDFICCLLLAICILHLILQKWPKGTLPLFYCYFEFKIAHLLRKHV